jgi:hypothetical protein
MIPFHEPWADEAQAWLLARSLPLGQLFHSYLGYEGSPGLWHFLLWCLIRIHVSYAGMHWVAGAIAVSGVAVLLFYSPFPRWLRLPLPFTFYLAFQYAVVARNYVLVPVLLFSAMALWRRSPIAVAALLGLLGNVSAHAAAISFGLAILYLIDCTSRHRRGVALPGKRELWIGTLLLVALYLFAAWTAFPPPDVFVGTFHVPPGHPVPSPFARYGSNFLQALLLGMWFPPYLGILVWPVLAIGIRQRGGFHLLIPVGMFVALSIAVYAKFWHAGLVFLAVVAVLWITWPEKGLAHGPAERWLRYSTGFLVLTQIAGTCYAGVYDHFNDYSGGLKTAQFLRPYVDSGEKIAVTYLSDYGVQVFHTVDIAPYFPQKLFMNQPNPFWYLSNRDRTEADFPAALQQHPRVVVALYQNLNPFDPASDLRGPVPELLERSGYHFAASYCGTIPGGLYHGRNICDVVFLADKASGMRP